MYNDRGLHGLMGELGLPGPNAVGLRKRPMYWTLAFFVLGLFVAVPKDRARRMVWKIGRRLRGPELVDDGGVQREAGPVEDG